jgi:predicted amidohydrolase
MSEQKWNVSLIQMDVTIGQPEKNYIRVEHLLHEAIQAATKPDLIILPEMWNTGYALEQIHALADEHGERTKSLLSAFSQTNQVNIIGGSIAERRGDQIYNTMYAFDRTGTVVAEYSKIHLFRLMDEEKYLTEGDHIGALNIDGTQAGMMICYDIRFPELARKLALSGVKILFVPAEWPHPRLHHWRTLLTARAIENQMYVVACNRVGTSGTTAFFGHSMVIDPWGEIVSEGAEDEAILTATIDLALVSEVRGRIPVFEDRRPEHY